MLQAVTPKAECEESSEDYGRFVVEPLDPGFGITIGNSLRRVLISALTGAAVTAAKIEGVQHEFTTISHVKEDVVEFMLNLKELRLRALTDRPGRLFLEAEGEGQVCAGDIRPSADFEVVNPELHLASLDSADAQLNVVLYVELGKGYVPAGRGGDDSLPLGVIPVDAIYTPVRRVNYSVEKIRVGQGRNYDRLILEVWTDGTISPTEALYQSAGILASHFTLFHDLGKVPAEGEEPASPDIPPEHYEMPLEQLDLSARTFNALRRSGITKVGELLEKSREDLLGLRSFGQKSLEEVWDKLGKLGLLPETQEEELESAQDEVESGDEKVVAAEDN
ncbi:MAG: DNA-directed RNA polymerase subunit alpha [Dehalococcoidia bacterium]